MARSEYVFVLGSLLVLGCEGLIGADFGSYRVGPHGGEASGAGGSATGGEGGAEGGSGPSGGVSGSAAASGEAGTTGGSGATGGDAGSGGSAGGDGGLPPLEPTSCAGTPSGRDGIDDCGPTSDENCCRTLDVPGGTFNRRHSTLFPATISAFRLDRYEVTIARFRTFVSALDAGYRPEAGSGKHTHLPNGGLDAGGGVIEPGWVAPWNDNLIPANGWDQALSCFPHGEHYTPAPGPNENKPVLCVNWYQAYAFCIWDGGFLPTAAESNFAATGGDEQRLYAWSTESDPPDPDPTYAVYGCLADPAVACSGADLPAVGSRTPKGDGKWGHADLAGSTVEWGLDSAQVNPSMPCEDCVYIASVSSRWAPGASWSHADFVELSARAGGAYQADAVSEFVGVRCARVPLDEGP